MSGYYQRNRDRGQYRGQSSGGGNYNQNTSYQNQGNMGRQQMMNPWQSGMMPAVGGAMQAGRSDEAALAFNILNQVLASDTPMLNSGQSQGGSFQDRKSRQMGLGNRLEDRRRGHSPPFGNRNRSDRGSRQWSSRSRSPHGRDNRPNQSRRDGPDNRKSQEKNKFSGFKRSQSKEYTPADKRRKSSDKEKEHQSSEDKSTARGDSKPKEMDDAQEKQKDKLPKVEKKTQKDKEYDETVLKCLKCHICEVDSFESIESFRNHKKSDEHKLMADIYNQRSEAALQVMRADAKLAANRDREKSGNANKETFYTKCPKCDCIVADAFRSHTKSIEHELVDNHVFRECCGSTFIRRKEFEEHRITIPHLKRQAECKKECDPEGKVVLAFTAEEEAAGNILRQFKETHRLDLETPADFPDYDADKPIGLGYIHKKRRYNCKVCQKSFPSYNSMALAHCRSFNHYLMLLSHLETKLKDVEDDEITESDEKKDDQDEKQKPTEEEVKETHPDADNASAEVKDGEEEKPKEESAVEEESENVEGDEEMGENLPPLEDGGIILEDEDKTAEDEGETGLEEGGEFEGEDAEGDDHMSGDEQEKEPLDEGVSEEPETENQVDDEMKTTEVTKDKDIPDEGNDAEDEEEEEEEEEAVEEEEEEEEEEEVEEEEGKEVKQGAARGRRGKARGDWQF